MEQKADGKPPKTEAIIGEFLKQEWHRDTAINVGWESFDATDLILAMDVTAIKKLNDSDETTDTIGLGFIHHDGPFEVYIVEGICRFFGIQDLDDLTAQMLEDARTERKTQPLAPFNVIVQRRSKTQAQIRIYAHSELQARQLAMTKTETITFTAPETVLDYQVIETIPLGLPQ